MKSKNEEFFDLLSSSKKIDHEKSSSKKRIQKEYDQFGISDNEDREVQFLKMDKAYDNPSPQKNESHKKINYQKESQNVFDEPKIDNSENNGNMFSESDNDELISEQESEAKNIEESKDYSIKQKYKMHDLDDDKDNSDSNSEEEPSSLQIKKKDTTSEKDKIDEDPFKEIEDKRDISPYEMVKDDPFSYHKNKEDPFGYNVGKEQYMMDGYQQQKSSEFAKQESERDSPLLNPFEKVDPPPEMIKKKESLLFQGEIVDSSDSEDISKDDNQDGSSHKNRDKSPEFLKFGNGDKPTYAQGILGDDSFIGESSNKQRPMNSDVDLSNKNSMASEENRLESQFKSETESNSEENTDFNAQKSGLAEYKPKDSWNHKLKKDVVKKQGKKMNNQNFKFGKR